MYPRTSDPKADRAEHVRQSYAHGRSDGFAQGAHDEEWYPAITHDTLEQQKDEVALMRDYGGTLRAFVLGYARGYREATMYVNGELR